MNENNIEKYSDIFNQLKMINALTEQQAPLEKYSASWNTLESLLVEEECKLFNDLILLELDEVEYLFETLPILPMLGLHLYKCMFTNNYKVVYNLLSPESKNFITMMWEYWQQIKERYTP